jgi:hypothetical protein
VRPCAVERIAPKIGMHRKKPGEIIFRESEPSVAGKGTTVDVRLSNPRD